MWRVYASTAHLMFRVELLVQMAGTLPSKYLDSVQAVGQQWPILPIATDRFRPRETVNAIIIP